jgi:membrane fusion protein (multidrug efflux system)
MLMPPVDAARCAALALLLAMAPAAAAPAQKDAPPPAVTTTVVTAQPIVTTAEFIGHIQAIASFEARARVEGVLQEVAFREGETVAAGQLLYVIEPALYEAQLAAAQAQQTRAEAQLREAGRAYDRAETLRARGTASQATLDQALAARNAAQADVLAAKSQVDTAQLNLSYTRITSPIDGRIGATAVTQNNLVNPQTGVLATVVQLDPIRVSFAVSDRQLLDVMQRTGVTTPRDLIDRFVPSLRLASGAEYGHPGRGEFIDNQVDPRTGTVNIRAVFPNPERLLLPGQFVTVLIRPEKADRLPVVPVTAIQRDRDGAMVLVVGSDGVVQPRRVRLGAQVGQRLAVEEGLQEGETVVVEGQQKVRAGMTVRPVPAEPAVATNPDRPAAQSGSSAAPTAPGAGR